MREILFIVWIVVLFAGIGLFMFVPKVFEPLLCEENESIEHQTREISTSEGVAMSTDLYCLSEDTEQARAVGETVGVPFVLIMVILPFVILRFNRSPEDEPGQEENDRL